MIRYSLGLLIALSLLSGCATPIADKYTFAPENVQTVKAAGAGQLDLGEFRPATPTVESEGIGMRGGGFSSPYGTFSDYLRAAIEQELSMAGRYSPGADTVVSGVIQKHVFNANGISEGVGELTARIEVKRDGVASFDKEVTAKSSWASSFAAANAIPTAIAEYPRLIREFIHVLFTDPDFINATR